MARHIQLVKRETCKKLIQVTAGNARLHASQPARLPALLATSVRRQQQQENKTISCLPSSPSGLLLIGDKYYCSIIIKTSIYLTTRR